MQPDSRLCEFASMPYMSSAVIQYASTKPTRPLVGTKVAYLMSRFPKLTETFVLYEILAVEREGIEVQIYPLQRTAERVTHPEAARLVERAQFQPWLSWAIVRSHLHFLLRRPWNYLNTLARLLWANFGSLRYLAGAIAFFPKAVHFARLVQRGQIDHVHAHFASHPAAVAWVISRLTGIPYSFTAHGTDLHCDRHMLREKVAEAEFVVTISNYNRDLIVEECGEFLRPKVQVIHCGVDTTVFTAGHDQASSNGRQAPVQILCIGTLHEVKGQTYLIEACRRLRQNGLELDCHFAGNGPDLDQLTRQANEAGLAEQAHFHGACPRAKIANLLRRADIVVAPSVPTRSGQREGIPVALMEAMASGVPVVASRLSGIPELVIDGETGLLVPLRDAEALTAAIARLAGDELLRRRLARAARQNVEREFNLDRNAACLARRFCDKEAG
jgi:colanic acid/amylovoran biosynthesis glycosyltransferase